MTGTDLTKKEASGLFFGQNARILLTLIGCVALYCAVPTMVWAGDEKTRATKAVKTPTTVRRSARISQQHKRCLMQKMPLLPMRRPV